MLRRVKLYGELAKFVGHRVLEAEVSTPAEAIRFLVANWPSVEKHMLDQHYKVFVGNYNVSEEELNYPIGQTEEIKIVPVAVGAGGFLNSGPGKIITGVALVGLSVATGGFGGAMVFGTAGGTGAAQSSPEYPGVAGVPGVSGVARSAPE